MATNAQYAARDDEPVDDQIVFLHDLSWEDYERLLTMRGDHSAPRISYLDGEVEIMSPSQTHEAIKSSSGSLVETYGLAREIRFSAVGSWTLKSKDRTRGTEPDDCWIFGDPGAEHPHLAVEVVWTAGRIDKLDIYRRLGVAEVWYWRKRRIQPHGLRRPHPRERGPAWAGPGAIDLLPRPALDL